MTEPFVAATIGSASCGEDCLGEILDTGCRLLRFNLASATDWEEQLRRIERARGVARARGVEVGVWLDLPAPRTKIRLGLFEPFSVRAGELVKFGAGGVPLLHPALAEVGRRFTVGDGSLGFEVEEAGSEWFAARALVGGDMRRLRSLNLGLLDTGMEWLEQWQEFAQRVGPVWGVALSFVRSAEELSRWVDEMGTTGQVIAKVEDRGGLRRLAEISEVADYLLLGRGDLGTRLEPACLGLAQEYFLRSAQEHGFRAIVATQLLESMAHSFVPRRPELCDLTSLVRQGVAGLLLADETSASTEPARPLKLVYELIAEVSKGDWEP